MSKTIFFLSLIIFSSILSQTVFGCDDEATRSFNTALNTGNLAEVKSLVESGKIKVNESCLQFTYRYPIHNTIFSIQRRYNSNSEAQFTILKYLLESGADANSLDGDRSALERVSFEDCANQIFKPYAVEISDLLIKHGADINYTDGQGRSLVFHAISEACKIGSTKLEYLLKKGAKIDFLDDDQQNPFHYHARLGWDSLASNVKALGELNRRLKLDIDINQPDKDQKTPLHVLTDSSVTSVVMLDEFFKLGANPKLLDRYGDTAFDGIVENRSDWLSEDVLLAQVKMFIKAGADLNSALYYTVRQSHRDFSQVEELLLASGANVMAYNGRILHSALYWAPWKNPLAAQNELKFFFKHGAKLDFRNDYNGEDAYGAFMNGFSFCDNQIPHKEKDLFEYLKLMVAYQKPKFLADQQGKNVVHHLASQCLSSDAAAEKWMDYLLDISNNGAVQMGDYKNLTALHHVISDSTNFGFYKSLVKHGANLNSRDNEGRTPLMYAASRTTYNSWALYVVEALIADGAEINLKDNDGDTALDYAWLGAGAYRILLDAGAVSGRD